MLYEVITDQQGRSAFSGRQQGQLLGGPPTAARRGDSNNGTRASGTPYPKPVAEDGRAQRLGPIYYLVITSYSIHYTKLYEMVYYGDHNIKLEEKPKPTIQKPTDVIVKILKTTICGTDLGIYKGKNPEIASGRILGHEGVGIIEEVGSSVSQFNRITSYNVCYTKLLRSRNFM